MSARSSWGTELLTRTGGAEQLRAALQLGESAPTLAGRILTRTVQDNTTGLAEGNANMIVATARSAAAVIAPLPPTMWSEHIRHAADLINDAQAGQGDPVWLQQLITAETLDAATAWQPPAVEDPYNRATAPSGKGAPSRTPRREPATTNRDALARAAAMLERLTNAPHSDDSHSRSEPDTPGRDHGLGREL